MKLRITILNCVLLLLVPSLSFGYSDISVNTVTSEERALASISSDPIGDVNNQTSVDLIEAWMGDDNDHLFFTIHYEYMNPDFSFVNVTLENTFGELFLIMVFATDTSSMLIMTHATSLVDDDLNTGENCYFVEYNSPYRVQRDVTNSEISFYIDWVHIHSFSGQNVNVVFWTGLSSYSEYDRMPNQNYSTYEPQIANRNTLFYFDDQESISAFDDPTSSSCLQTSKPPMTTTVVDVPTIDPPNNTTIFENSTTPSTVSPTIVLPVDIFATLFAVLSCGILVNYLKRTK